MNLLNTELLSKKQLEYLNYAKEGLYNKEIADRMGISINTVKTHAERVNKILGKGTRSGNVVEAVRRKLITL